ncbi:hypothetical protein C8R43DRAFT_525378 [Mycena crocata]|nr:hypothetical protein C8R43DRAFT_525378 [Mycena crocata]
MASKQISHLRELVSGPILASVILSALLLSTFAYLACRRVSRRHLNRVSFRLLVYALISNLISSILSSPFVRQNYTQQKQNACAVVSVFSLFSILFSACMFFSMALNIPLVIIYRVDGKMMEKYYLIGSFLLCTASHVSLYVARRVGWVDPRTRVCWARGPNSPAQIPWIIGTQTFWLLVMSLGEVISVATILGYMLRQELRFREFKSEMSAFNSSMEPPVILRQPPIVKYRSTIIRIGLYPILSCCLSIMACVYDALTIHNPKLPNLIQSRHFLVLYTLRPIMYLLLAATDPGFLLAIRALRSAPAEASKRRPASTLSQASTSTTRSSQAKKYPKRFSQANRALVHVELEGANRAEERPQVPDGRGDEDKSEGEGELEIHVAEEDESIVGQL